MSFDLNITVTVNGNRCKQYQHQGKTFIEAKEGSEYVIEVKNNYWKRILAVGSVDGLNVLTGKTAHESDSGYIIGAYSSEKIKGFRFSDDEWALFKFGYKFNGKTYAQSKEDGSEKNCGVIGLRFFYEKEQPVWITNTTTWLTGAISPTPWQPSWGTGNPQYLGGGTTYTSNVNFQAPADTQDIQKFSKGGSEKISKKRSSAGGQSANFGDVKGTFASAAAPTNYLCSTNCTPIENDLDWMQPEYSRSPEPDKATFDMGTEWGRKERSKVRTVSFERGALAQSMDIYYASREALIAMGVPIETGLSANLPQSFPNTYATPPKGWNG